MQKKLKVAFVEGSRKSVCRNSGWFITDHSREYPSIVKFIPLEQGRSGVAKELRNLRNLRKGNKP